MNHHETAVLFDMRAPEFGTPAAVLYAAALEMAAFADDMHIGRIGLMEHHASEDGYLPSPFVMGGGVAARTKHSRITLGAVILPLHDPVKIAEHIAVLDLMSGGRLEVIFGAGYVPSEFSRFNVSLRDRGRLLDLGIDIILRALRGERFQADGREVFVRPQPVQAPEDIVMVGGGVEASARRAARFGVGFAPLRNDLFPLYDQECRKYGRQPGKKYGSGVPLSIHVAEDPEKAWALLQPHATHVAVAYAKWAAEEANSNSPFKGLHDEAALRRSGIFAVWTPDEVIAKAPAIIAANCDLRFMPLLGGLAPEAGWTSLELIKNKVLPRLAEARQAAAVLRQITPPLSSRK
jgi:alkanesulfonate monooxygenase SsuD/methylene tetrahydromethanopterin reductase-like flavin-dependent oxidoreductase (luciferase family)